MAFTDTSLTSQLFPNLNRNKIHTKCTNCIHTSIVYKGECYETCCKSCRRICPRTLANYKAQLKNRQPDNFVLFGAKYIGELYCWTSECLCEDDFLRSFVVSIVIFAIGMKLTSELNTWNLLSTVGR